MKTLKVFLFFAAFSMLFVACSDDDDGGNGGGTNGGDYITAKIDGADWSTDSDPADLTVALLSNGILTVQGSNNDGEAIRIMIANYNGAGTYTIGTTMQDPSSLTYVDAVGSIGYINNGIVQFGAGVAQPQVVISSDDGSTVQGTFAFVGVKASQSGGNDTINVTDGEFSANYE